MARVLGLEALRMADTDMLPYDYVAYAREIRRPTSNPPNARRRRRLVRPRILTRRRRQPADSPQPPTASASSRLHPTANPAQLNAVLRQVETALLSPDGLPNRPWYKHTIYAPGEFTGYAAVVIPGVNEAIESKQAAVTSQQLAVLTKALDRAAQTLESAR